MLKNKTKLPERPEESVTSLRVQIGDLKAENAELRSALAKDRDHPMWWSLSKVARQRDALSYLCARNTRLRFQLRTLEELGRGLTKDEFLAARAKVTNEDVGERIGKWED